MSLYERCAEGTLNYYSSRFQKWLVLVDNALGEMASKGTIESEKNRLYEGQRQLRACGKKMSSVFSSTLAETSKGFAEDSDEYNKQVDLWIACLYPKDKKCAVVSKLAHVIDESNVKLSETLWKLNMRLAFVRGGHKFPDEGNPFAAGQLGRALYSALTVCQLEERLQILAIQFFSTHFLQQLDSVLDKVNKNLVQAGIFPNLRYELIEAIRAMKQTDSDHQHPSPLDIIDQQDKLLLVGMKQGLIRIKKNLEEAPIVTALGITLDDISLGRGQGADTFHDMEMVFAISSAMSSVSIPNVRLFKAFRPIADQQKLLLLHLQKLSRNGAKSRLQFKDIAAIDLLGQWFDGILQDTAIAADLRYIFSYLYLPFVKIAILDSGFLSGKKSVGRQLLLLMVELAEHWSVQQGQDKKVYPKLCAVGNDLLHRLVDDLSVVDELWEDLSDFSKNIAHRSALTQQRTLDAEKGSERLESMMIIARHQFLFYLKGSKIPRTVCDYLERPCVDFFSFILLRYGQDSVVWHSACDVMQSALYSLTQAGTPSKREVFLANREKIQSILLKELAEAGHDKKQSETLVDHLRQGQDIMLATGVAHEDELTSSASVSLPDTSKACSVCTQYFGHWFLLKSESEQENNKEEKRLQVRLVWNSRVTKKVLFTSRLGLKHGVFTAEEIKNFLKSGVLQHVKHPEKTALLRGAGV